MSTASLPVVYTWAFPGSPLQIRLKLSAVHGMRRREGAGSPGGLVLGSKPRPGITEIRGFQPLAGLEAAAVEQALKESQGEAVGFYRFAGTGNLSLNERDAEIANRSFAGPGSVVLLIEADGAKLGKAVFAVWDQGRMTEFPLMEFPFDGYRLAIAEAERMARKPSVAPAQTAKPRNSPPAPRPEDSPAPHPTAVPRRKASAPAAPLSSAPSYTWSFPGSPIRICIHLTVVDELQRRLSDKRRLVPTCGLLVGEAPRPGTTEITGFLPLASLEPAEVKSAVLKYGGKVMGFYRSKESSPLTLAEADLALATECFSQPGSVILVMEEGQSAPGNAVFFFWDDGKMHGDLPLMEFPLDAGKLAGMDRQREPEAAPETAPALEPVSQARRSGARRLLWYSSFAAAVLGAASGYRYARTVQPASGQAATRSGAALTNPAPPPEAPVQAAPPPAKVSLGFTAARQGSAWILSWNPKAPMVAAADFGMLVATEGSHKRNLPLTSDQLRTGSLRFRPSPGAFEIQLSVVAGEHVARESVLVIPRTADAAASEF